MAEVDDRRLPLAVAKMPLLSAAQTTRPADFPGVEHRIPFSLRVEPINPHSPRACLSDEPTLIALLAPVVPQANAFQSIDESLEISPAELERQLVRSHGGRGQGKLLGSLHRLANTMISTDYGPSGRRSHSRHPLLTLESTPSHAPWTMSLSPLLLDQVVRGQLIKPPPDYFDARGLRRRLWSLALAFCGRTRPSWKMPMLEVWRRSGSIDVGRKFAFSVARLLAAESVVPGFQLTLETARGRQHLVFTRVLPLPDLKPQIIYLDIELPPDDQVSATPLEAIFELPADPVSTSPLNFILDVDDERFFS